MFRHIISSLSALTINDLKDIENHLNSFASTLETLGDNSKEVSFFLDEKGFSTNKTIKTLFTDIQQEVKLLREDIVAQRKVKKEAKKDAFSLAESKMVSLEDISHLLMQKLPCHLEGLEAAEKKLDLLIQLLTKYHNYYLIIATELLSKEEVSAMRQRDLLRSDLYMLHVAIISRREQIQKQKQNDQVFESLHEERALEFEFQQLKHQYSNKLRQNLSDEHLIKKIKIKLDNALEKIAEKADELEFRAAKQDRKGNIELAARLRVDASTASDLAHALRVESAKLRKLPAERSARVAKLEQFNINCQNLLDEAGQTELATRHYKWWRVVVANVAVCITGIGLVISCLKWLATGRFLFFSTKDSAQKIMDAKEVVTLMANVGNAKKK